MIFRTTRGFFIATFLAATLPAAAQDYPNKPLRVITVQGAGGLSDIFIRAVGEELHKEFGQPLIVENRVGANGNIGARACADAPPDGYTFCIIPSEVHTYNTLLMKNSGFDPEKSLVPITQLFVLAQTLAVTSSLNVKTMDQLAALSKAKPGTLSYQAAGLPATLYIETFKKEKGADLVRVPFKGGSDAINGMLSGATPIAFFGLGNLLPYLQAGTVTGLAINLEKRSSLVPDVPTLRELGYNGPFSAAYFGLNAPQGTPRPIIMKLRDVVAKIAGMPAFRSKHIIERGFEPVLSTPDEYAEFIRRDRESARQVVNDLGPDFQ